jgi:hypothetical protein
MSCKEILTININVDYKDLPLTWRRKKKRPTTPQVKKKIQSYKYSLNDLGKKFTILTLLQLILNNYHIKIGSNFFVFKI